MDPFGKGEEINEEHERHQDENGVAKDVDGVGDGGSCDVSHADPVIVKGGLEFAAAGRGHVVLGELPVGGPDPCADADGEAQNAADDRCGPWGHAQEDIAALEWTVRFGAVPCAGYFQGGYEDDDDQRGDV